MFNFKLLKIDTRNDKENSSSFVGIRRNISTNELEFRLPRGFKNFPNDDFNATKKLFFTMYRTFKKFEKDNKCLQSDKKPAGKDNLDNGEQAYQFKDNENNEVILYSKISIIENLLETYKELALDVIIHQNGRSEEIDYSKINQYLHQATYLDDDVIYIDEMELPRHYLNYTSSTLINLFCFILYELENELEQESNNDVKDLADCLREEYLTHDQSLFNEETFDSTIISLKDILNNIDKVTPYKDEHYWQLYESIESFLYGELNMEHTNEDGIFWGISNFYQIWEDMCNTYAFSKFNVLYSDTNIVFKGERISNNRSGNHKIYKKSYFEDPFFIQFREKKRLMRPDLIHLVGSSITGETFKSFIDIIPIKDSNNQIDFRVHFIDNKSNKKLSKYFKRLYKAFISNLKQSLNSGKRTSHRIHGASFRNNVFKNYPKDELTKQKNYLIDRTCDKNSYIILDWKYMDNDSFQYKNKKIDIDISKQICYEFCLKNSKDNDNYSIESQFIFPYYYDDLELDIGDFMNEKKLYHRINENNIKVFKANFNKIQDIYLKNDT